MLRASLSNSFCLTTSLISVTNINSAFGGGHLHEMPTRSLGELKAALRSRGLEVPPAGVLDADRRAAQLEDLLAARPAPSARPA